MPINIIFPLISFLPVILGIIMVSHNTYKFFGNHPELGFDTENKAIFVASLVFFCINRCHRTAAFWCSRSFISICPASLAGICHSGALLLKEMAGDDLSHHP